METQIEKTTGKERVSITTINHLRYKIYFKAKTLRITNHKETRENIRLPSEYTNLKNQDHQKSLIPMEKRQTRATDRIKHVVKNTALI